MNGMFCMFLQFRKLSADELHFKYTFISEGDPPLHKNTSVFEAMALNKKETHRQIDASTVPATNRLKNKPDYPMPIGKFQPIISHNNVTAFVSSCQ